MAYELLIIDDDKDLLSILGDTFKEENYSVTLCSNGSEALKKCNTEVFDLIISDIMLPGATGLEILREAKKSRPEIIVILITGYASLETAIEAIREGAYDYITKPFKLEQIKITVRNALDKIALIKENKRLLQLLNQAYEEMRALKQAEGDNSGMDRACLKTSSSSAEKTLISDDLTPHLLADRMSLTPEVFVRDLERISLLKDKGLITTKEFEICKAKLFQNLK